MPTGSEQDPRTRLVREKYFSLRPKPLEQWLWQQNVSQAAERVFWLHWEEGMKSGDWCSQVPLKRVARLCCIDASTVTRAYQLLKSLGLLRRQDAGRDPDNPFHQATSITEVRLPKQLLSSLLTTPNRFKIKELEKSAKAAPVSLRQPEMPKTSAASQPTRGQVQATWGRASTAEQARFFRASRDGSPTVEFDQDSRLTEGDRQHLLRQLEQMAVARNTGAITHKSVQSCESQHRMQPSATRRLSTLLLARARQRLQEHLRGPQAHEIWRQIVWASEEGALRRFEPSLALNIAVKKVRQGAWTRPNRMPSNWGRLAAQTETCIAA
jgi:hypothetical protein